jgi:hypothetical protein
VKSKILRISRSETGGSSSWPTSASIRPRFFGSGETTIFLGWKVLGNGGYWWILIFWVKHLRLFWYVGYWYAVAFTGEIQPVSNGPPYNVHEKKYPYPGKTPDLVPESERKNAGHFHQK